LGHKGLKQASAELFRRDVAGLATEVGTLASFYHLKAARDGLDRRQFPCFGLNHDGHASLTALRAPKFFVPVFDHRTNAAHCLVVDCSTATHILWPWPKAFAWSLYSRGLFVGYLLCEPTASFDLDQQIRPFTTDLIRQIAH
jgi:hypothetical protein